MSVFFITQMRFPEKSSWELFSEIFNARCKEKPGVKTPFVKGENAFGYYEHFAEESFFGARVAEEEFFLSTEGRLPKKTVFRVEDPELVILARASVTFLAACCPEDYTFTLPDSCPEDFIEDVLYMKREHNMASKGFANAIFSGNASGGNLVTLGMQVSEKKLKINVVDLTI